MTDDTYTHDPTAFDGDERDLRDPEGDPEAAADHGVSAGPEGVAGDAGTDAAAGERTFGWRGWVLVGWMVIAFAVVPGYLFFYPHAADTLSLFGLGYRDTYLFLPLLPAILLGLLAVWATTRS